MNLLDENIPAHEAAKLISHRIPFKQIGLDVAVQGIKDEDIIRLLHSLKQTTFFTCDSDFYKPNLRHLNYCLV